MRVGIVCSSLVIPALLVGSAWAVPPAGGVVAAKTDVNPGLPVDKSQSANKTAVIADLKSGTITNAQVFDDFFVKYELPRMTSPTLRPEAEGWDGKEDLPAYRRNFRRSYFTSAKAGPARAKLNDMVLEFVQKKVLTQKLDEVVRYNALLMVSELNEEEGARPVKPYAPAFPLLMKAAEAPSPKADYLKVAALVGLQRHAEAFAAYGGPADRTAAISSSMLKLLAQKQSPEGRTPSGHAWLRASAVRVLGSLGDPGKDNLVMKTLGSVVADEDSASSVRFAAVEALGQLKYPSGTKTDIKPFVREIGKLALATFNKELETPATATATTDTLLMRRKLKSVIRSFEMALKGDSGRPGLAALAESQDKSIKQLTDALKTIEASLDKDAVEEVIAELPTLEGVLQTAFGLQATETDRAIVGQ